MPLGRTVRGRIFASVCLAVAISLAGAPAAADDAAELKGLLDAKSSSIVTLKTVVQMRIGGRGAGNEQEIESEVAGAMISPEGLVICSNMQLSGPASAVRRMLGGNMPGLNISSDVTSVKVVLGPDDEELDAKILARDEDLDLAWVQVEKPEKSFDAIDLKKSAEAELGERLVGVRRMGKMFDRTPVVALATVVGHLDRPRTLLVPQEELTPLIGLPVFNRTGDLVGIVVTQLPEAGDAAGGANPMTALLSMASSMQEGLTGLILPAAQVLRATERAQAGDGESEKPSEEAAAQ